MNKKTEDSLEDKLLSGQKLSLGEKIQFLKEEKILPHTLIATVMVCIAGFEWWKWYVDAPYFPALYTIAAIFFVLLARYKFVKLKKRWESQDDIEKKQA